jgi:hypothetical protein
MKRLIILLALIALGTSAALAAFFAWNINKQPSIALPQAYLEATRALGAGTNQFYCIGGVAEHTKSKDGEWHFTFSSTNLMMEHVYVFMDGKTKTQVIDGPPLY